MRMTQAEADAPVPPVSKPDAQTLPDDPLSLRIAGYATNEDGTTNYGKLIAIDLRTGKVVER